MIATVIKDFNKAFDEIPHSLLLAKLSACGMSSHSCNLLKSYLSDRRQRVRAEDVVSDTSSINSVSK